MQQEIQNLESYSKFRCKIYQLNSTSVKNGHFKFNHSHQDSQKILIFNILTHLKSEIPSHCR